MQPILKLSIFETRFFRNMQSLIKQWFMTPSVGPPHFTLSIAYLLLPPQCTSAMPETVSHWHQVSFRDSDQESSDMTVTIAQW